MADDRNMPNDLPERAAKPMQPRSAGAMTPRSSGQMASRPAAKTGWQAPSWIVRLCQWLEAPFERQIRSLPEAPRRAMLGQPSGPASVILHGSGWYGQAGKATITTLAPGLVHGTVAPVEGRLLQVTLQWPPVSSTIDPKDVPDLLTGLRQDRMTAAMERTLLGTVPTGEGSRKWQCTCRERTIPFCQHVALVLRAMVTQFAGEPETFLIWRGLSLAAPIPAEAPSVPGPSVMADFWDGPAWPADLPPMENVSPAEVRLPAAPITTGGKNLALWLQPAMQKAATAAANRLGLHPSEARTSGQEMTPRAARRAEPKTRDPQAWSPLPEASFRSMDWAALSAYCKRHLPGAADEQGERRFVLSIRNGHAQAAAQRLRDALQRWQKVMTMEVTSAPAPARASARDSLSAARSWIRLLDEAIRDV